MDIQKEREAFEQALVNQKNVSINNLHVCTIFDAEKNKYSPSDVCDPKEDFIVDWINSSWSIWQAAKAQADQKIKLLLCDEHLKKCESPTGVFNSQYPDEEPCLICLAKEAKAQAVPEKTVKLHLVWNENKDECVGFLDSKDARYTATGDDRGMFGVTALGDYFRDLNDERNEFETQIVMIEAQEQGHE